jgi:glycosyltransferase involved in cell wall biosynthesis
MTPEAADTAATGTQSKPLRLGYVVSHPIQYQAPLLRRIAADPAIDLTVMFGSDFSLRGYRDEGFGVTVAWDVPLLQGYRSVFLKPLRDNGTVSSTTPISRDLFSRLASPDGAPAFDALWVHGYASINSLQAMLAAKARGIPVLLRAESWLADRPRSALKLAAKTAFFRTLGALVDAVLPIGAHNADYWAHYLPHTPQFPMPYAVDNAYFAGLAEAAHPHLPALRESLSLDDAGRPVILFASKLQPRKHADHLLHAFAAYLAAKPDSLPTPFLLIVGDGEERAALEALTASLGLTPHVRFPGFRNQSELPAFFALSSVFVLPSRHEPWGLITNEAMATGCPVILSADVGAAADLVTDGIEGALFPVGDIPALTAAIARVLATPETPARMGQAARRHIATWTFEQDLTGLRAALAHTTRRKF